MFAHRFVAIVKHGTSGASRAFRAGIEPIRQFSPEITTPQTLEIIATWTRTKVELTVDTVGRVLRVRLDVQKHEMSLHAGLAFLSSVVLQT